LINFKLGRNKKERRHGVTTVASFFYQIHMTEEMMTEDNEHSIVTIDELREIAEKNTRWRKAVEYLLNDDDIIISAGMKTTWGDIKFAAELLSTEEGTFWLLADK